MSIRQDLLRELVSHDGLKDSLTGLLAFPAFIESARREISSAERNKTNLNLYLVSVVEKNATGERVHVARSEREIADRSDDELYALAARVTEISHAMKTKLRTNDLITRYTFAEFLIMNSGDTAEITKKLSEIVAAFDASVVGIEMITMNSAGSEKNLVSDATSDRNNRLRMPTHTSPLLSAISTLELEMSSLLGAGESSVD